MRPSVLAPRNHGHAIAQYADPHPVYAALFGHLAAPALELGSRITSSTCRSATPGTRRRGSRSASVGRRASRCGTFRRWIARPPPESRFAPPRSTSSTWSSGWSTRRRSTMPAAQCPGPTCRRDRRCGPVPDRRRAESETGASSPFARGVISASCLRVPAWARRCTCPIARCSRGDGRRARRTPLRRRRGPHQRCIHVARDHGHVAACLHFATANIDSTTFWTGVGFAPVMVHLRRRLDERILDLRPTATAER